MQVCGGIADFWYLSDGDILCDPRLVIPYMAYFDVENPKVGAERNIPKTKVLYLADAATMEANAVEWRLDEVRAVATVMSADESEPTLGVVTGSRAAVGSQLQQKVEVVRAIQSRVAICQDAQTECILIRQSLGVGRISHILHVHGDELLSRFD